ncbi:MAG TPA: N-acetylglucosamine-6-phosphate deacetylase [Pyrinomonadaceae bacterium]|nr:N-acetylglucosamine-6-phosphate deacetylase [Pyrinomonadaceae bacterium]HMP65981.1 N-acetylglucosamine-6-phosphate deacetylase [Pyrinomonadaceae bacterium]
MGLWVKNAKMPGGDRAGAIRSLYIEKGTIAKIGGIDDAGDAIDAQGAHVLAGFVDVHNHGAVGIDVNSASAEELFQVAAFLARNGVTTWMPTLVPDTDENYERIISEIDRLMVLQEERPVARAVGVHYEGVFANEKMCGALRPEYFKKWGGSSTASRPRPDPSYTGSDLIDLPRLKNGIHMTTLAPEIDGGIEIVKELVRQGWIAAIGHTSAELATLNAAFEAGARHVTHFFNAMSGIHHREIGVAGWALTKPGLTFDIIPDGIHVVPTMLKFACRAKGLDEVCLISDSVAPTGLGDGEFTLWGEKVSVKGGQTCNERGSIAGSVATLTDGFRQLLSLGFSPAEIEVMASRNPARLLGLLDICGAVEVGKRADLVAIDDAGRVVFTMVGGEVVPGES